MSERLTEIDLERFSEAGLAALHGAKAYQEERSPNPVIGPWAAFIGAVAADQNLRSRLLQSDSGNTVLNEALNRADRPISFDEQVVSFEPELFDILSSYSNELGPLDLVSAAIQSGGDEWHKQVHEAGLTNELISMLVSEEDTNKPNDKIPTDAIVRVSNGEVSSFGFLLTSELVLTTAEFGHYNQNIEVSMISNGQTFTGALAFSVENFNFAIIKFASEFSHIALATSLKFEPSYTECFGHDIETRQNISAKVGAMGTENDSIYAIFESELTPTVGTPVLRTNGEIIGMVLPQRHGTPCFLPIGVVLWDKRYADLAGYTEVPPTSNWVSSTGMQSPDQDTRETAFSIGRTLAGNQIGLQTSGQDGTDRIVSLGMIVDGITRGKQPSIRIAADESLSRHSFFERFQTINANELPESSKPQILLALGESEASSKALQEALSGRLPVAAPPTLFSDGNATHRQFSDRLKDIADPDELEHASIESITNWLSKALSKLFNREISVPTSFGKDLFFLANDNVRTGILAVDLLDLDDIANQFAQVITSKEVTPPLAIGLFGPWGSGKSYFMTLVEQECNRISSSKGPNNLTKIASIWFNAWHYADQNLWASLATNILDGTAQYLAKENPNELAYTRKPTFAEVRFDLVQRLKSNVIAKTEARELEAKTQRNYLAAETAYQHILANAQEAGVSSSFSIYLFDEVKKFLGSRDRTNEVQEAIQRISASLGHKRSDEEVASLMSQTSSEMHGLAEEAKQSYSSLGAVCSSPGSLILISFGILGAGFFVTQQEVLEALWAHLIALAPTVTAILAVSSSWRARIKKARILTDYVARLGSAGDSIYHKAAERFVRQEMDEGVKSHFRALVEADKARKRAKAELEEAEQRIVTIEADLHALDIGKPIYDFATDKLDGDGGYRDQQGIVASVRRDLEDLQSLLSNWRARGEVDVGVGAEEVEFDEATRNALPIQRIVLYIDDLDRCPEDKVVDVLQAVHLLLSFELFIVVLGVDARWLERSLKSTYGGLLGDILNGENGAQLPSARPHDYLEKIFQIPYSLPHMRDVGFSALVKNNLPTLHEVKERSQQETENQAKDLEEIPPTSDEATGTKEVNEGRTADTPQETTATKIDQGENQPESQTNDSEHKGTEVARVKEADEKGQDGNSESEQSLFYVEQHERNYLDSLHRFIITPRAVKRFTNIYRLIRVQMIRSGREAFVDRPAYIAFVGTGESDKDALFRYIALLLAINVGFPEYGACLLRYIQNYEGSDLTTLQDLIKRLREPDTIPSPTDDVEDEFRSEIARIVTLLNAEDRESDQELAFNTFRDLASRVGRFSMYWRET